MKRLQQTWTSALTLQRAMTTPTARSFTTVLQERDTQHLTIRNWNLYLTKGSSLLVARRHLEGSGSCILVSSRRLILFVGRRTAKRLGSFRDASNRTSCLSTARTLAASVDVDLSAEEFNKAKQKESERNHKVFFDTTTEAKTYPPRDSSFDVLRFLVR